MTTVPHGGLISMEGPVDVADVLGIVCVIVEG